MKTNKSDYFVLFLLFIISLALLQCFVIPPVLYRSALLFRGVSIVPAVFRCSGVVPLFRRSVPTHLVFLNHVVRGDTLNQVFGIRTILSALLSKAKSGLQKTTWFKPSSLFVNFLKNDIMLFSWHLMFSEKTTWFKPSSPFLNFVRSHIMLFSFQFSLRRQHGWNEVVHF